ncbi:MAG: glycine cleavage system protein GcvH [Deltaproteobacteria bacterium]|jgi:glycine cleavage system H protein|nr:glycine cleavage system protein GcvH [Deltaproteobacteria bacterium]MBT4089105.1 glycine cleavage system protein GcvH [Deltaproteobacteria bacterium]MBT4263584.1 glycine cleavage system protein GcvH [Deltaproteobacteria bacterium]MBT4644337.1 glycine cleavage system protein GcvH [Deltaproteobacteria bacterium]MBT6500418.1 glycine cleavage system protein GcvH [Deltaproteobacteria bacterium]
MEVRSELLYTDEHEWLSIDGNIVTLGITDYAQNALTDIVYVELPEVGTIVESGEAVGSIESVKAVSELYSPVSGEVIEVNRTLEEEPEMVNTEPYDEGWIVKLQIDPGELTQAQLLNEEEYLQLTQQES